MARTAGEFQRMQQARHYPIFGPSAVISDRPAQLIQGGRLQRIVQAGDHGLILEEKLLSDYGRSVSTRALGNARGLRIKVLLPNSDSTRSTASTAVLLRTSKAGFNSMISNEATRPVSAIISMHSCASR